MTLTKHKEGSFRELWGISLPLMISSLSLMMMVFVDRLLLSQYSIDAHNATVNASTMAWSLIVGWISFTTISEVFVAQFNGAGMREKIGEPVWQMIWVSFGTLLFFIPMGIWGGTLIFGSSDADAMKRVYFDWMMFFGPNFVLYGALCGYFVGQGKTKLITVLAVITNFLNAIFDYLLIFGLEGYIPSMGVEGAAIATSVGSFFQVIVLACIFLNKNNRQNFGTGNFAFNPALFKKCITIGIPNAIFVTTEVLGWAAFYWIMTLAGDKYITIAGICQDIYILFYFVGEGVNKAAITIAGNLIGAKRQHLINNMLRNGVRLHLYFFLFMVTFLFFFEDFIIHQFLPHATPEYIASIHQPLTISLYMIVLYILFEGICFLYSGILTAAGDVFFLLTSESIMIWIFLILPVYGLVLNEGSSLIAPAFICLLYAAIKSLTYYWRYREGKWQTLTIATA
jgi:MATE family multidrug resistance protein